MSYLDIINKKIFTAENIQRLLAYWRFKNRTIVFTNGCFDIIHLGHISYLAQAADLGNELIIGLNSDNSVKRLKGTARPLNDQLTSQNILASLSFVSAVIVFDDDTPANLIKFIKPDILVKGADYKPENIAGYDFVTSYGGKVVCIDLVEGYSSSNIIDKIRE